MRVHFFQHVSFEKPGFISEWCRQRHYELTGTCFYENNFVEPDFEKIDLLIVMGGPMNCDDEQVYPWLKREKEWTKTAIQKNIPVLGICLGAQLLAECLGANVYPGKEKEIGWFPISLVNKPELPFLGMPKQIIVFHWHGDTFDLPQGASHAAFSKGCRNQAFLYGKRVVGLQFHLEVGEENIREIIEHSRNELVAGKYIQGIPDLCGRFGLIQQNKSILFDFLDRWMNQLANESIQ
ncbi:type 1 glutamine amidotransferase [Sporolactobacillus sp. STSJ-5]|uniref:type 1 glutamine amidotransferase n=1 Tax=Sporolactobacillus sp. STSJ-5 TaxID=2965076 RepID=UPI002105EC14|nr:type 1 glutamine amidotransferase [Sporolactobacillus sp. STSJ-5]MCQ2008772.1 type 1 glutamine amidotransferase [Sporolactobacillus sp. STSJ-5]